MTRMEYIGGCSALPKGERLRCASEARTVSVDSSEDEELSRSLLVRFGGRARLMFESEEVLDDCRNEDADDLSERRLDLPVNAALVKE
jgi:hypothetical protein